MSEFDRAKEYFKKLKIIEEFVDGNTEVAKKILDGTIKDIIVIKGRFKNSDDTRFGLFMIYINKLHLNVLKTVNVISELPSLYRYKPLVGVFDFQRIIDSELKLDSHCEDKTQFFSNVMERFLSSKNIEDIIAWIEGNLIIEITNFFTQVIEDMLSLEGLSLLIDFENISSVQFFEKSGIDAHALHMEKTKGAEKDGAKKDNENIDNVLDVDDLENTEDVKSDDDM